MTAATMKLMYRLDGVRAVIGRILLEIGRVGIFMLLSIVAGLGSSWYLTRNPSPITARVYGPWVEWRNAGTVDADPYTRARFARTGELVLSSAVVRRYEARADSTGQNLASGCDYVIEGAGLPGRWWSIAVYNDRGGLIANAADRYGFNSEQVALQPGGGFLIALARDAQPGNWLPTGGAGRLVVVLTLSGVTPVSALSNTPEAEPDLPLIRRVTCG